MKNNPFNKSFFLKEAIEVFPMDFADIESCLVLAPHADDESLGCGGLISMLRDKGVVVNVIITTDGSQSHPNSKKFPTETLKSIRRKEALKALGILGVDETNVTFFEGRDSSLPAKGQPGFDLLSHKLSVIIRQVRAQLILVPYELDPHCDHRATWQLLDDALNGYAQARVWQYPIWLYELAKQEDIPQLKSGDLKKINIEEFLEAKIEAIESHVSQTTKMIDDDPAGFILTSDVIAHFTGKFEYYIEKK